MNGWLRDTNAIAVLSKPEGTARVLRWTTEQDEDRLFISILTFGEYDKGLSNLPEEDPMRARIAAGIAALEVRCAGRILPLTDAIEPRGNRPHGGTPSLLDTSCVTALFCASHDADNIAASAAVGQL